MGVGTRNAHRQQGLERFQRLGRLLDCDVHASQVHTRGSQVGVDRQSFQQVAFSQHQRTLLRFHHAGHLQHRQVVGNDAQQLQQQLFGLGQITVQVGQVSVDELSLRMLRQEVSQLTGLRLGGGQVAVRYKHRDQCCVRLQIGLFQGQHLAERGLSAFAVVVLDQQDLALQHPTVGQRAVFGKHVVQCRQSLVEFTPPGSQAGHQDQCRPVIGNSGQRGCHSRLGFRPVVQRAPAPSDVHLQRGLCRLVIQRDVAVGRCQRLVIAGQQQGTRQRRQHLGLRHLLVQRLGQLHCSPDGVAGR